MIIQLTDHSNNLPVYMETSHFVAMHTVGTAKPHTYIILTNNSLQVKEDCRTIIRLVIGEKLTDEDIIKHCVEAD